MPLNTVDSPPNRVDLPLNTLLNTVDSPLNLPLNTVDSPLGTTVESLLDTVDSSLDMVDSSLNLDPDLVTLDEVFDSAVFDSTVDVVLNSAVGWSTNRCSTC